MHHRSAGDHDGECTHAAILHLAGQRGSQSYSALDHVPISQIHVRLHPSNLRYSVTRPDRGVMKEGHWAKLLIVFPLCCATVTIAERDKQAIGKVAKDWKAAYNNRDASKVAALYTEDAYYLSAHILAHGRPEIEAYWRRGILAGGHIEFIKPLTLFASGDLGYSAGTYQATNAGKTVDGRILLVLRKVNGRWLIAAHETVVRDQP